MALRGETPSRPDRLQIGYKAAVKATVPHPDAEAMLRRTKGEGGIYRRKDGLWCAALSVRDGEGRRRRRVVYGKTRREVSQKLFELRKQAERGGLPELSRLTVRQYLERWLEDGARPEVRIIQGDILQHPPASLTVGVAGLKVVGNIPYNLTSPILFFLLTPPRPLEILLMVQKEVGDRILASPGTSAYGALSVGVQTVARVERILRVPPTAFRPMPAVESVVLRISPVRPPPLEPSEEEAVRTLTRAAFQQRRKQFQRILRNRPDSALSMKQIKELEEATGFDLRRRPETFSPSEFVLLARALDTLGGP